MSSFVSEIKDVEKIKHTNTRLRIIDGDVYEEFHESDEYSESDECDEDEMEDYEGWYDGDREW